MTGRAEISYAWLLTGLAGLVLAAFLLSLSVGPAPVGLGILWLRLVLEFWVYGRLILRPDAVPVGVPTPPDPREDMDA